LSKGYEIKGIIDKILCHFGDENFRTKVTNLYDQHYGHHSKIISESAKLAINEVKGLPNEFVAKKQHEEEVDEVEEDINDKRKCNVCMDALRTYLLKPCNHVCLCSSCLMLVTSKKEKLCPICRTEIKEVNHIIFS
jgi:hypothetical protein